MFMCGRREVIISSYTMREREKRGDVLGRYIARDTSDLYRVVFRVVNLGWNCDGEGDGGGLRCAGSA